MAQIHEGGCSCGAVRYRAMNAPVRTSVCHCTFCQRRTGSAFGIGVFFRDEDVEFLRGELKNYEHRSDETQRWLRMQFCAACGNTVTWTVEALPGMRAIAGGTFDDPNWLELNRHVWTSSAQKWVPIPHGVERSRPVPLKDIDGMSGGPIFALKKVEGTWKYSVIGVQSAWYPQRRIIAACPFSSFAFALEDLVVSVRAASARR